MSLLHDYLQEVYKLDDKEIAKIFSRINVRDMKKISERLSFYRLVFGYNDKDVIKLLKNAPSFLCYRTSTTYRTLMTRKINILTKLLHINNKELGKIVLKSPTLLSFCADEEDDTSVQVKFDFYKNYFGLTEQETRDVIIKAPQLLGLDIYSYNPTSVRSKTQFLKKELDANDEEISEILKLSPYIWGLDTTKNSSTSIKAKLDNLSKMGFDRGFVKTNPTVLFSPVKSLKIRYMLFKLNGSNKNTIGQNLMTSEEVVYARRQYLLAKNMPTKTYPYYNKTQFRQYCGEETAKLVKQYPLTQDCAKKVEEEYNSNFEELPLHLEETELACYKGENA